MTTNVTLKFTLGTLIGAHRIERGWSQRELAKRLGISPQYMSDIENDRRVPRNSVIQDVADLFEIGADPLYYAVGKLPPDIDGDYRSSKIQAAFDAMRAELMS